MVKLAAGFYQGKFADGTLFQVIKNNHWEVVINSKRFFPYETKASAINCAQACKERIEKPCAVCGRLEPQGDCCINAGA